MADKTEFEALFTVFARLFDQRTTKSGVPYLATADGEVLSLERTLDQPAYGGGGTSVHDVESLLNLTKRGANSATCVYVDFGAKRVTAVLDDAKGGWRNTEKPTDSYKQLWGAHRVSYQPRWSEDWEAWRANENRALGQLELAELLEDLLHTVTSPPAAQVLETVLNFKDHRTVQFESSKRLSDGLTQFKYHQEKAGVGLVEVPEQLALTVRLFHLEDVEQSFLVDLRYRLEEGALSFRYKVRDRQRHEDEAFARLLAPLGEQSWRVVKAAAPPTPDARALPLDRQRRGGTRRDPLA